MRVPRQLQFTRIEAVLSELEGAGSYVLTTSPDNSYQALGGEAALVQAYVTWAQQEAQPHIRLSSTAPLVPEEAVDRLAPLCAALLANRISVGERNATEPVLNAALARMALLQGSDPRSGSRGPQIEIVCADLHAVVSAVNELRRGGESEAYLAAENFRSYYGVDDFPFTEVDRSVAVVSASSSGSLAARLKSRGFDPESVIHLLFLGESRNQLNIAIDLAFHKKLNPSGHDPARRTYEKDCALCTQGSMFIELRGDQFDISPPQPMPLVVRQKHAPEGLASQMERLVGSRCSTSSASRLHWIDPDRLLSHPPYRDRLDYYFRRFVPAGAQFCVLADDQSAAWGREAAARSGQTFHFVRADLPNDIETAIKDADGPLLVMAAVIGSGRRLLDISRELRTAAPRAPITYIVGFAKPASAEQRKTLKNSLVFSNREAHHAFETVEEMVLPSARRENAWEQELEFLRSAAHSFPGRSRQSIDRRIEQLANVSIPLVDNLFGANERAGALALRPGFAFWPEGLVTGAETQADVFATVSSVLQSLRTAGPLRRPRHCGAAGSGRRSSIPKCLADSTTALSRRRSCGPRYRRS